MSVIGKPCPYCGNAIKTKGKKTCSPKCGRRERDKTMNQTPKDAHGPHEELQLWLNKVEHRVSYGARIARGIMPCTS